MKSFSTYLFEKVEQRDLKDAAKDTNIRIGAEFEVILPELLNVGGSSIRQHYDIDRLSEEYNDLISELDEIESKVASAGPEYREYLLEYFNDNIEKPLSEKIAAQEKLFAEVSKLKGDWATTDEEHLDRELAKIEKNVALLNQRRAAFERLADTQLLEAREHIVSMIEDESIGIEIDEDDYPQEFPDWVEDNIDIDLSSCTSDLDNFYRDIAGIASFDGSRESALSDFIANSPGAIHSPSEVVREEGFDNPEDLLDMMEDMGDMDASDINQWEGWEDAPFDFEDAKVGDYHASSNYSKWRVETDSSLNDGGIEIISPIMELREGLTIIKDMFNWIKKVGGDTDQSTGFHINLSYKGKMGKLDLLKLMLFMDEGYVEKQFAGRLRDTGYSRPVTPEIRNVTTISASELEKMGTSVEVEKKFSTFISKLKSPENKYFGINIKNANYESGRVEFRYMGGPGYHKNYKKVEAMILRYAYLMRIAADPMYKRKEYLLKLARLFNKWDTEISAKGKI